MVLWISWSPGSAVSSERRWVCSTLTHPHQAALHSLLVTSNLSLASLLEGQGSSDLAWKGALPAAALHVSSWASGTLIFISFLIFMLFSASPEFLIGTFPVFVLILLLSFHFFFFSPFWFFLPFSSVLFPVFLLSSFFSLVFFLFILIFTGGIKRSFPNSLSFSAFSTRIFLLFSLFNIFARVYPFLYSTPHFTTCGDSSPLPHIATPPPQLSAPGLVTV